MTNQLKIVWSPYDNMGQNFQGYFSPSSLMLNYQKKKVQSQAHVLNTELKPAKKHAHTTTTTMNKCLVYFIFMRCYSELYWSTVSFNIS